LIGSVVPIPQGEDTELDLGLKSSYVDRSSSTPRRRWAP